MSDTIKKLLLCTVGIVSSLVLATISAKMLCNPWPCAASGLFVWPMGAAVLVGVFSLLGFIVAVAKWAGWNAEI